MTKTINQPQASDQLCRVVFQELFEKNLLGFLYSSQHFQIFIFHLAALCSLKRRDQAELEELVNDEQRALQFNKQMLAMFDGIYIDEATCSSHRALLNVLDRKLVEFETNIGLPRLQQPREKNQMLKVWSYSKASHWGPSPSLFDINK